jgi:hypothetical protein
MQPLELLARLADLVPPPRHPLIRFHGVLAPHSSWRKSVGSAGVEQTIAARCTVEQVRMSRPPRHRAGPAVNVALPPPPEPALDLSSRSPWAELLERVYDVDTLACRCGGRLRPDESAVRLIERQVLTDCPEIDLEVVVPFGTLLEVTHDWVGPEQPRGWQCVACKNDGFAATRPRFFRGIERE